MTKPKRKYEKPLVLDMEFNEAVERIAQTDPKEVDGNRQEELQPLELYEDVETGDQFVLCALPGEQFDLQLRFDGEEPWATRKQMADLFGRDLSRITRHINNILREGELDEGSNVRKTHFAQSTKPVEIYSLDMVLSVGYRVRATKEAIMFRRWANQILKQYLLKGFVIDTPRLEDPDGRPDYFEELMSKIRSIRASEKRMWTRVLELASFCTDFNSMTEDDKKSFFATIQNAMHWAVTQETAAEVIWHRVDASKEHAGVTHFTGSEPSPTEAKVAKNYYAEPEIEELNTLTNAMLEFFEAQVMSRVGTTLAQFIDKMREFIDLTDHTVIQRGHRGRISMTAAREKATSELATYKERKRLEKEHEGEVAVAELLTRARAIAKEKQKKKKTSRKKKK